MIFECASIRSGRSFIACVVLMTVLGLGLRLFRLSSQSFWIDEVTSTMAAQGPLDGIYERSAFASNSLPIYSLLLKLFVGNSTADVEFRARLLSAIAGALSVPVFTGVVYLWRQQRGVALLSGLLLAVNPLHLWYSQEVRGYAVMLLFGLLTLLCFELAQQRRKYGWWILYILSALTTAAVHRTGLVFFMASALWHGWNVFCRGETFRGLLIHLPVAAAMLVMLMLKSHPPPEGYGRSATGLEIGYTFLTFAGGYSFGPSLTEIQSYGPWAAISRNAFQTGILVAVLWLPVMALAMNFRRAVSGKEFQLLVLSIGIVSAYAFCSGFPYNVRYALPGLFGFLALIAALTSGSAKCVCARLSIAGLLLVSLWADGQWFYSGQYRKNDSRAVAQWLIENKEHVHSWTVLPGYQSVPVEWYLKSYPDVLSGKMLSKDDRTTTFPPVPDALIIGRRHHLLQPEQVIASYSAAVGKVRTIRTFAGFEIYTADP